MIQDFCQGERHSCSSCCGLYNINLDEYKLQEWLSENTRKFLNLNPDDRKSVIEFRQNGESQLQPLSIRQDVYICPFLGFTSNFPLKTGCLLHPSGSPHPEILLMDSPQTFSFYGQNICQTYNCRSKEIEPFYLEAIKELFHDDSVFLFGKFSSNYNLIQICIELSRGKKEVFKKLAGRIFEELKERNIPVTSFEMPLCLEPYTRDQLWHILGTFFEKAPYLKEVFEITPRGKYLGEALKTTFA